MISKLIPLLIGCGVILASSVSAGPAVTWELQTPSDSGYLTNSAIDGLNFADRIWLATGKGLNVSADAGISWARMNIATGLISENISALYAQEGRMWIGSSHMGVISGQNFTLSDGVSYSDDTGKTWTQVNFGSSGLNIPYVWGGDRVVYDVTGLVDTTSEGRINHWLWFGSFAGGLLASQDNGDSWRRVYASIDDSIQYNTTTEAPSYRNLLFSCAADKSHPDSVFLWAGTAGGVFQYVHVPKREKFGVKSPAALDFCDTCTVAGGTPLFIGGHKAFSRGRTVGGPFISRFDYDGLPGTTITAVASAFGKVFVGTADDNGASTGLAVSTDIGDSFVASSLPHINDSTHNISDILRMGDRLYLAEEASGLMVSSDSGANWSRLLIDSSNAGLAINKVNAVNRYEDFLAVGTDTGVSFLRLRADGSIIDRTNFPFGEGDSSASRVIRIRPQVMTDSLGGLDSVAFWTAHRPLTGPGTPMVGRLKANIDTTIADTTTPPDGLPDTVVTLTGTWQKLQVGAITFDVNFVGDTAFAVGSEGLRYSTNGRNPSVIFSLYDSLDAGVSMDGDTIRVMEVRGDTVVVGSDNALAISPNGAQSFRMFVPSFDTLKADVVVNFTALNTADFENEEYGLTGDFMPALAVQPMSSGPARVWASGRPVSFGTNGISVGRYVTDSLGNERMKWKEMYRGDYAWNFAFKDSLVFAAANVGLLRHKMPEPYSIAGDTLQEWDTVALVNGDGVSLVNPGSAVYAVEVVDSFLWVGTDDGTVRLNLGALTGQLYTVVDSTTPKDQVYAFPVPFSPQEGQVLDFHFVVPSDGNVTLEIYDFAMNLVARPIDNVFYAAGIYPNNDGQGRTWDGKNGKGDVAAVGVYYFRVTMASGEERWGKLVVIP